MGSGTGNTVKETYDEWAYPTSDRVNALLMNMACVYADKVIRACGNYYEEKCSNK